MSQDDITPSDEGTSGDQNTEAADQPSVEESAPNNVDEAAAALEDAIELDPDNLEGETKDDQAEEETESEESTEESEAEEPKEEVKSTEEVEESAPEEDNKEAKNLAYNKRKESERKQKQQDSNYLNELRQQAAAREREVVDTDDVKAQLEVLRAKDTIREVELNQKDLIADNERVIQGIGIFNPDSDDYIEGAYETAVEQFANDHIQFEQDQAGNPVPVGAYDRNGNKVSLYKYMNKQADLISLGRSSGETKGQKAAAKQHAAVETPGVALKEKAPDKADPDLLGFDDDDEGW